MPGITNPAEFAKSQNLKKTGSEFKGSCPACGGHDRFHVTNTGIFGCRNCGSDHKALTKAVIAAGGKLEDQTEFTPAERPEFIQANPFTAVIKPEKTVVVNPDGDSEVSHPYLEAKGIGPNTARVNPKNPLELHVAITNFNGERIGTQTILADGSKRFTKDMKKSDGALWSFTSKIAGAMSDGGTWYLTEGFADAASIRESGFNAVWALDSNNLPHVAKGLVSRYPKTKFMVAADNDKPGLDAANKAGLDYVLPGEHKDFNDLYLAAGAAGVTKAFAKVVRHPDNMTAEELLMGMSMTGESDGMLAEADTAKFAMPGVAQVGYWVVLYAAPNTGKTLITLWMLVHQIKAGEINAKDVFYANCDDTFVGGATKLKIAEKFGFNMLIPYQRNFTPQVLTQIMMKMARTGEAKGKIIVLDTLKKFVNLMKKDDASDFGKVCRGFVQAGGTLICLAHVNKRKSNGDAIQGGTSDIPDDADTVFTMDTAGNENSEVALTKSVQGQKRIVFSLLKQRGPASSSLVVEYNNEFDDYMQLFDSVRLLDGFEAEDALAEDRIQKALADNYADIEIMCGLLRKHGELNQGDLVSMAKQATSTGVNKLKSLVHSQSGHDYLAGHRWKVSRIGEKNAHFYRLLDPVEAGFSDLTTKEYSGNLVDDLAAMKEKREIKASKDGF